MSDLTVDDGLIANIVRADGAVVLQLSALIDEANDFVRRQFVGKVQSEGRRGAESRVIFAFKGLPFDLQHRIVRIDHDGLLCVVEKFDDDANCSVIV